MKRLYKSLAIAGFLAIPLALYFEPMMAFSFYLVGKVYLLRLEILELKEPQQ